MIELPLPQLVFLVIAALSIFAAFNVILQRNPLYSALSLIVTLCSMAGLFLMLDAQFVAAMQVIVYAGAIMVLFVFVIMLLNVRTEEARQDKVRYLKIVTPLLFIALLAEVIFVARSVGSPPASAIAPNGLHPFGTIEAVGEGLFSSYLIPFEATSVLILMAMVGAMVLAKKRTAIEAETLGRLLEESEQRAISGQPMTELEEAQAEIAA